MPMKIYAIYILTNKPRGTLYIGVTNNLKRRMQEHKRKLVDGFTQKYDLTRLVYVEQFEYIANAIR
jgi:putative endonuclease